MTVVKNVKKKTYFFSEHASKQLHSRSKMTRTDVLRLLYDRISIPVGSDKHRIHTLIYSVSDSMPLVIVHDERNGEIVTILYTDYNNKFVIDPSIERDIKDLTLSRFHRHKQPVEVITSWIDLFPELRKCPEVTGLLTLSFVIKHGEQEVEIEFLTIPAADFSGDVSKIKDMPDIKSRIDKGRNRKNIKIEDVVQIVTRLSTGRLVKLGTSKNYINPPNPENAKKRKKTVYKEVES